jgi:hypothetical protein
MNLRDVGTRNYFLAVGTFLAVLFTVLAPEGSTDLGLAARLLQWTAQVAIPLILLIAAHLALSRSGTFDRWNPWLKLTISGIVGSLLFAPLALTLDFVFGIDDWHKVAAPAQLLMLLADEILGVVLPVTLVWIGINAPRVLGLDFSQPSPASQAQRQEGAQYRAPASALLKLLPGDLGADIVFMKSELHYLRVVTTQGSALVLYNLRDAIEELPPDAGMQPHRSYWVALKHLERLARRDGKPYLRLRDGSQIPVSRRRLSEARALLSNA